MKKNLVIVGNGMSPGRMLERLLEKMPDQFDITIFNAEPRVNYNRLMLSPVLSGEKSYEEIITHDDSWYEQHGIALHKNSLVSRIDREKQVVYTENNLEAAYDHLVIATGSSPFILPLPGKDLDGVMVYRDLDDVEIMINAAKRGGHAVVIGGGLLGLEAAAGLEARGLQVTVLHLCESLMERQLDPAAAYLLKEAIEQRGINVITGANTKAILGNTKAEAVVLEDDTEIKADIVVMAVGIRPSTKLAIDAGLEVNRGIVVDDSLCTSDPAIFALGECVEHAEICYGLVAPLYDMAAVLADRLCAGNSSYKGSVTATKLKVSGIDLYSAGDIDAGAGREEIVLRDATAGVYKRLVLHKDKIIGVVLYGDTVEGPWFFDLLKKQTDITEMRETLVFGQNYQGGVSLDPGEAVAALPDDAEICGCNGVCKSSIVNSINARSLTTIDEVRAHTKASSSCGTCTGLVEQLMTITLGDSYKPADVVPLCPCIHLGHDDVRRLIVTKKLKSVDSVFQALEWTTSCGCAKCRPAINYYLVCEWPEEYKDDYQSRFINERVHANIQRDGTYSVVPRMWGGMTTAAELRAIADVVDKFDIPAVKVTGGQRIDMLGVQKDDLPAVWADLGKAGFISGQAYAKGLRTVKTCVGKTWCRFGTQDSTGLGIKLEKFLWGSWSPAKLKLAVSGCPRNCAEATCKDIGVICIESGYDIHFAGAAGLDIQGTVVLGHVNTEDEVIEYVAALTQMYRKQGHYLERIYKWARRVGVEEIRKQLFDEPLTRKTYYAEFVLSQKYAQVDPWSERTVGKHNFEFTPIKPMSLEVVA